jgi:hypothetical protein
VPGESVEVYDRHGRVCFAFPTSDKLFAVFIAWPISELAMVRADIERQFLAAVDACRHSRSVSVQGVARIGSTARRI